MLALRITTAVFAAAALVLNAIIHLSLAGPYDAITGTLIGQGDLFRMQAAVGIALAVLLIAVIPLRRTALVVAIAAAVVAAGGLALVVITAAVPLDLTALGLPYLFEPIWFADKITSVVAQAVALGAALASAALAAGAARNDTAAQP